MPKVKLKIPLPNVPSLPKLPFSLDIFSPVLHALQAMKDRYGGMKIALIITAIVLVLMTIGIYAAQLGTEDIREFPDPGTYDHAPFVIGNVPEDGTQTLRLILDGSERIHEINMDNLEIGAEGMASTINITGNGSFLICESVIIDGLIAQSLVLRNSNIFELILGDNVADGNSFSPTISGEPKDIVFGSTRGALNIRNIQDSDFDRIVIETNTVNATCGTLSIRNVETYGSPVILENIHAGTLTINNSIIGSDSGIGNADFVIESTTKVSSTTIVNNVERPVTVR